MTAVNGFIPAERRAQMIADCIGMGPMDTRRKRVFETALAHIRAAVAIAANGARLDHELAHADD